MVVRKLISRWERVKLDLYLMPYTKVGLEGLRNYEEKGLCRRKHTRVSLLSWGGEGILNKTLKSYTIRRKIIEFIFIQRTY